MAYEREVEIARVVSALAADAALRHQSSGVSANYKADNSPVTIADQECEQLIAAALLSNFPEDGILGEEGSVKQSANGRRWIIDPIDGTRDFLRGNPLWSILIALEENGEVKAGVVYLPICDESYFALRDGGAYLNDAPIGISNISDRAYAALSVNGLGASVAPPYAPKLLDWMSTFWSVRSLGGTPDAMWLASGRLDVWIEPKVAPWDIAAPQVILEEAGAVFHDHKGERTIYGGNAVAYVPALRAAVNELLGL